MTASFALSAQPDPAVEPRYYTNVPSKRLVAWVIDVALIGALSAAILPLTAFTGVLFFPGLMLVTGFFYRWFTLASGSATWGMRIMGIELRSGWGEPLSGKTALLHTAGYTACVIIAPMQLISVLFIALSPRGQSLPDLALRTVAINRP